MKRSSASGARRNGVDRLESFRLEEGFDLYVYPARKFKSLTAELVFHRALGSDAAAAAVLESVLRRGSRGYPTMRRIHEALESLYGASLDSGITKVGERQLLRFGLRVLNDRYAPRPVRSLDRALDFLYRLATAPIKIRGHLRPDYVDQEKENLRRYLRGLVNDRAAYALRRCIQEMCPDEPYGLHEYGRLEDVDLLEPRGLTELHAELLKTAPVNLFVVGDIDPDRVCRATGRTFRRFMHPRKVRTLPVEPVRRLPEAPREVVETMEIEQARLILAWRTGVSWRDPEFPALLMANAVFGGYPHSRLFSVVREQEGLAYQASSFVDATKGILFASLGIDDAAFGKARDLVLREWEAVREGRIGREEFEKTRKVLCSGMRARSDSATGIIRWTVQGVVNRRIRPPGDLIREIEHVTIEDVRKAAGRAHLDTIFVLKNP